MIRWDGKWTYAKTNWSVGDYLMLVDYIRIVVNLRDCYRMAKEIYSLAGDVPGFGEFGLTEQSNTFYNYGGYTYAPEYFNRIETYLKDICNSAGISFSQKSWAAENYFLKPQDFNRIEGAMKAAFEKMAIGRYGQYRMPFRLGGDRPIAFSQEFDVYRSCISRILLPDINSYFGPDTKSLAFEWEVYQTNYILDPKDIYLGINGGAVGTGITIPNSDIIFVPIEGGYHCSYNWIVPEGYYDQIKAAPSVGVSFGFYPTAGFMPTYYMTVKKPVANVDFENVVYSPKGSATTTNASTIRVELSIPAAWAQKCKYVHIKLDNVIYVPTESGLTGYAIDMPLKVGENIMYIQSEDMTGQKQQGYLVVKRTA